MSFHRSTSLAPDSMYSVHYMPAYTAYLHATLVKLPFFPRASPVPTWRSITSRKLLSYPRQRWGSKWDDVSPLCFLLTHSDIVCCRTLSISSSRGRKGKLRQLFIGKFLSCCFSYPFENNWNSDHWKEERSISVSMSGMHTHKMRDLSLNIEVCPTVVNKRVKRKITTKKVF